MLPKHGILVSNLYYFGELENTRMNWETHAETVLLAASLHTAFGQSDAPMKNGDRDWIEIQSLVTTPKA